MARRAGFEPSDDAAAERLGAAIDDLLLDANTKGRLPTATDVLEIVRAHLADATGAVVVDRVGHGDGDAVTWLQERAEALHERLVEEYGPLLGGGE
jgi:hypothetical protein